MEVINLERKDAKKLIKWIQNNQNDPYLSEKLFFKMSDGNIPKIDDEPTIEQYGIPQNYKELIDNHAKKLKKIKFISFWISLFIVNLVFTKLVYEDVFGRFDISVYLSGFWVTIWLFPIVVELTGIGDIVFSRLEKFELKEKVEKFNSDYQAYKYWQYMKRRSYWEGMDGHQFENAVASIYRTLGFEAIVSKQGGDGGIDIILIKGDEKIAVQCKAHKTAVAPAVARDLYGTMGHFGYTKGLLISLNGFTKGVHEFVKDKSIELVTVEDLILMS